ncbi:prephenate dehydrogenase/arogenate dehydrogenase family protein [Paraeggerthella hongkongensis]|uniref:prephenate dehydrogenase n=1 Tax=Paraeggerthella TaxID=651554 RepID=UPI000DF793DE|nr:MULTISPECIES: prephenate dehydrogenase/arogenate dehydrogenase family protein [Paraeggerthella]MBU5404616.1 prephenate dehydrogenase/arogenate dehydrogenase family protein [Paraeggerthella hongkongensis]MCD2432311.1 prephenate dehydrogenase/arogenate dehydrogenase family protein [Paraeggerthella hominis]RDB60098.1 prephenate dehydrogenase/arogenate dehydrogenase family protein [Paraeggerthella hongkongensis]
MSHQQVDHIAEPGFDRVAVVGFGLVGASFAAAFRSAHPDARVLAVDVDQRTLAQALERGWATEGALPADPAFRRFVDEGCDLVVLATPVGAVEAYLKDLAAWDFQGIVTDTASTKSRIVELACAHLAHPENYVPGHPMAGSEKNGIEGARADLFKGAHWILCPDANTPAEHFPRLHELITSLGARVIVLPREDHDEAVAVVSHVPHIVASSLMQLASRHADDQQALMRLAAGGFKDSTRIAAGSPELWCGIAFDNKDALVDGLSEMQEIIASFSGALESGNRAQLTDLLASAAEARRALPVAWVPSTERLLEVRIPMENRTGVVAEVTTVTSSVGCNIQSIEIDHVTEDSAVLSLVLTDEGDVGQLSAQLINAGFSVSFSPLAAKEHIHVD